MTGTVTLSDKGQNYIEFDIINNVINEVRPARLRGWCGTRLLNSIYKVGGRLYIELQWVDYQFELKYKIVKVEEKIVIPHKVISSGKATDTVFRYLIDTGATFLDEKVLVGDTVTNDDTGKVTTVSKLESNTNIQLYVDIMTAGDKYVISRLI